MSVTSNNLSSLAQHGRKLARVLVVDDDKMMLVVLADMLKDLGANSVTTAVNGRAGIEAFDRLTPDLVLCDLHMPGTDGFQFMEELGKRNFTGPVVLVSGMDARTLNSASLMARFHRLNIVSTLTKPVEPHALRSALSSLV